MSKVKKAGCILLNTESKSIALVYREKQKDYSFPKGHQEEIQAPCEKHQLPCTSQNFQPKNL